MAHNIIYYNSIDDGLKQFSNTDVAQLSEYVLELMANGTYAGTITIGTANPIGTFTDTVRVGGVGSSDVTILSNTYTLSQVNTVQSTVDPPMYLGVVQAGSNVIIQENATTLNDLADEIIQSLISDYGVNSYYLGISPPSDGGTWVSRGALLDTFENFTVTNSDYRLWHKTISANYSSYKSPLKLNVSSEPQEWSSAEVQNLIKKVEERIVATSIGTYVLQASIPGTGTWVSVGTVQDVRRDIIADPVYTGSGFGLSYTGTYDQTVTVGYILDLEYQATFDTIYSGPGPEFTITQTFSGNYNADYSGPGIYVGPNVFAGIALPYQGAVYQGLSAYTRTFQGTPFYTGLSESYTNDAIEGITYATGFAGPSYTGTESFVNVDGINYTFSYDGPVYTALDTAAYSGDVNVSYEGPQFEAITDYSGPSLVVSNTSIISSVTLWKRVA